MFSWTIVFLSFVFVLSLSAPLYPPPPDDTSSTNDASMMTQSEAAQIGSMWELLPPQSPDWSYGFQNRLLNYTCAPVSCITAPQLMRDSIFHFIAGVEHRSNFPMMIFRVCEALHWCIPPQTGFKISLHYEGHEEPKMFKPTLNFFRALHVSPDQWTGPGASFSANNKMMRYLNKMQQINNRSRIIYHLDLDEFPDLTKMKTAVRELESGQCDAIRGYWCDRVSANGAMNAIKVSSLYNLQRQYPLRCNFSINYMPARTTFKILAYRSHLRVVSGQHVVWCDIDPFVSKVGKRRRGTEEPLLWDWDKACTKHVNARVDKTSKAADILALFPRYEKRARICPTIVPIDHYKWVKGIEWYLFKRILAYKDKHLEWWKQSFNILEHLNKHNGKICVKCPTNRCVWQGDH